MNRTEFKKRWQSDDIGGGITFDDIADCYVKWGLGASPRIKPIDKVRYEVLVAANTIDANDFKPDEEE